MQADVVIVGSGPTAGLARRALAGLGLEVVAVGPPVDPAGDPRTIALMPSSVEALEELGVDVRPHATALTELEIETTGPLGIVRERFAAADAGEPYLAQNLPVRDLLGMLAASDRIASAMTALDFAADRTTVVTAGGDRIAARLVIAADGAASPTREAAGIALHRRLLGRRAWCAPARLERPHGRLCIERYDDRGSVTVIPVGSHDASLICIGTDRETDRLAAAGAEAAGRLFAARQPAYGAIAVTGRSAMFPLAVGCAVEPARRRVVAIGEAAHVAPPIGAQGWNMAVRDAMVLREIVREALRAGADIGGDATLSGYGPRRRPDMLGRVSAVGLLAGLATRPAGPLRFARQAGLLALARLPGAKRTLMRAGLR